LVSQAGGFGSMAETKDRTEAVAAIVEKLILMFLEQLDI